MGGVYRDIAKQTPQLLRDRRGSLGKSTVSPGVTHQGFARSHTSDCASGEPETRTRASLLATIAALKAQAFMAEISSAAMK